MGHMKALTLGLGLIITFCGGIAADRIIAATEPDKVGPSAPVPTIEDYMRAMRPCTCEHDVEPPQGGRQPERPVAP